MKTPDLDWEQVRSDLAEVFDRYDLQVATGFTRTGPPTELQASGIAIRSQDERVDAQNLGIVKANTRGEP